MATEYVWGRQAVLEAMRAGRQVHRLYLAEGAKPVAVLGEIVAFAERNGTPIRRVPNARLERLASGANHQGVIAEAAEYHYAALDDLFSATSPDHTLLVLVLDHLNDPQNFGTLLRTADAVGVNGVVIPRERAAGITPAVVKSSAGAVEHLNVALVVNLARSLELLKERGLWVVGLDATAEKRFHEIDYRMPVALVVGSEGFGLSRLVREKCDLLVRLPMRGHVASLNAAVAGSIVLYEIWRQREQKEKQEV